MQLIGRDREVREVETRLRERRLVTVIGPGGIGKTAVAAAVAATMATEFEMGARQIDLTRVRAPQDVPGAIAGQLGFATFDALVNSPTEAPALVVVDNCEHVTAAAADAIEALLASCDAPRVLATSRSPLDLPGESLVVLGPLTVPGPAEVPGVDPGDADAVRLFLERARDAGADVDVLDPESVAALCRQLDGVPLALELAAAQTRSLRPAEILDRLAEGHDVLVRPRYRGDRRHRSLTATVDWSLQLLPDEASALLERLSLFAGPFTGELAVDLGADLGLDPAAADTALRLLVDASLVGVDRTAPTTRFRLLETVRVVAGRRLADRGELDAARDLLVDHVVAAAATGLAGARRWEPGSLARLQALYDSVVASVRWCLVRDAAGDRALLLCAVLWGVVHQGHQDEIAGLCDQVLARWPDPEAPSAADAAATAATARFLVGDAERALVTAEHALPYAGASRTARVLLRRAMAYASGALGDRARAVRLFTDVAAEARAGDLTAVALEADVNRAQMLAHDGDLPGATTLAMAARVEAEALASPINEVWAQSILAQLRLRRDVRSGLQEVEAALAAARRLGYAAAVAVNLRALAWGRLVNGEHRVAADTLLTLVDEVLGGGRVAELRGALLTAAALLHATGHPSWDPIAASARALRSAGPTGQAMDALVVLPTPTSAPLLRRDAIALTVRALRGVRSAHDAAAPPRDAETDDDAATLVDHGTYWEVTFAGRTAQLKASKGMSDIGRLLRSPGREVHCTQLMGAVIEEFSTGEVLDARARHEYEHRIRHLQQDLDDAEASRDQARADRARLERDALVDHLAAALGLGGRTRRDGGTAERARSAVTQRIRSTIRAVTAVHPELGRHLRASISTGFYCAYRPERPVAWSAGGPRRFDVTT